MLFGNPPAKPAAPAAGGDDIVKDSDSQRFVRDVLEASRDVPVVVDFWAPWCGPCKTLGPSLEKAVRAHKGKIRMVKVDIDKSPDLARQAGIQSIPTVYAFFQGRLLDRFQGALPDSQVKAWVDRLAALAGPGAGAPDLTAALEQAKQMLEAGDHETAGDIYRQILEIEPDNAPSLAGMVRCLLAAGDLDGARALLGQLPPEIAKDKEVAAAAAAVALAEQTANADLGEVGRLQAAVERDPADHQSRYDLAMALYGAGQREGAVDQLLELFKRDREWNEQAARKQLLKFFEAFGPTDKLTLSGRRRLSAMLFS